MHMSRGEDLNHDGEESAHLHLESWIYYALSPVSCSGCTRQPEAYRRGRDWCDRSCAHKGRCAIRQRETRRARRPRTLSEAQRGETGG